jgi:16S rRNA C967 or C1407 C5-methylase (RsmB/RsmF family)
MGAVQSAILARAAGLVRVGGVLGYAVCSPTHAEGREVVQRLEALRPDLQRLHEAISEFGPCPDPDGIARIGPWLAPEASASCPDAYQLVLWRRTA